jgi:hypothetical protein
LNDAGAYTNRVNASRQLEETISAGYLRADLRALDNRLWLVAADGSSAPTTRGSVR